MNTPILETLLPLVQEYARKKARMWMQGEEELAKPDDDLTTFLSTHGVDWDLLPVKEQDEIRDQYIIAVQVAFQPVGSVSGHAAASLPESGVIQPEVVKAAVDGLCEAFNLVEQVSLGLGKEGMLLRAKVGIKMALSRLRSSLGEPAVGSPKAVHPPAQASLDQGTDAQHWKERYEVACNTISQLQNERYHRDSFVALSNISSFLGQGLGDPGTSAEDYEKRIRAGIDEIVKVESQRASAQTPDHSALLIEAREALELVKEQFGDDSHLRLKPAVWEVVDQSLSKLQSIKL